jgi:indoleamine 2,3-dioxygenase
VTSTGKTWPIAAHFTLRGFLPVEDPATRFTRHGAFAMLDDLGRDLPSLLHDGAFRHYARELVIPLWPDAATGAEDLPELRLYYVRLGFLASGYINQVGAPKATLLPRNIAVPLARACRLLGRPPILSYDGYALYNWKRFRPGGPVALGNIDTIQDFVHLYDEHWFILVHVEIEAVAARILAAIDRAAVAAAAHHRGGVNAALVEIAAAVQKQIGVLRRMTEKMDPAIYYKTFRPYISFFEDVVYEGVDSAPMSYRGETGAQSSIMPTLVAFMKIAHQPTDLTDHLADMRTYMPPEHRALIEAIGRMPPVRGLADRGPFNDALEAMAEFREVHYGWAEEYINKRVSDPRGTGGTPYMKWLRQLIAETRAAKI